MNSGLDGAPRHAHRDALHLQRLPTRRLKYISRLEQANIVGAAIQVVSEHVQHARNHRGAHHRSLVVERVREVELGSGRKAPRILFRNEGQGNGLAVTERQQGRAQSRIFVRIGQLANLADVGGKRVWELVVAVQARQFFDDVDLAFDVEAPAGDVDQVSIFAARKHHETETSKDAADFKGAEFFAENAVHFPQVELYGSKIKLAGDHVNHVADERAAAGSATR